METETNSKSMEEIVADEIKRAGISAGQYINNFWMQIPGNKGRTAYDLIIELINTVEEDFHFDRTSLLRDICAYGLEIKYSGEKLEEALRAEFSELYLSKTFSGFLDDVEGAITASEVDRTELKKRVDARLSGENHVFNEERQKELLLPVYIELRKKGYLHRELVR